MSALAFLYYIIPFFFVFFIHVLEEIFVQRKWMKTHHDELETRYPQFKDTIYDLSKFSNKSFIVAIFEEFLVTFIAIVFILVDTSACNASLYVWSAVFMAFYFHLLVHIFQAIVARCYIPGLFTAIFGTVATFYITSAIINSMSMCAFIVTTILGVIFMMANMRFAHWLGAKIFPVKQ